MTTTYTPDSPKYDIDVELLGHDSNAFTILARVDKALKDAGVSKLERDAVRDQAMDGDYNHLLWFVQCMVNVV